MGLPTGGKEAVLQERLLSGQPDGEEDEVEATPQALEEAVFTAIGVGVSVDSLQEHLESTDPPP